MAERLRLTEIPSDMKTVGILGGMGAPEATTDFEQKFHTFSRLYLPQKYSTGYPPLVTAYFREVPLKVNDDGSFADPPQPNGHLLTLAQQVGAIVDFLVIISNTPHFFQREIEKAAGKEVLSMVDVTINEIKRRRLKKVGVLAVGLTLKNKLYQSHLDKLGISWEAIPDDLAEKLDQAIFAMMEGRADEHAKITAQEAVEYLRKRNSEGIILGCTEIPLLLEERIERDDIVNPTVLLAEAAVMKSIGIS